MPDAMLPYSGLPDLTAALAEFAARERSGESTYPLGCCLLFTHRTGAFDAIAFYVDEYFTFIDALTGDDCVVFVAANPGRGGSPTADDVNRVVIETARHLDLALDALPCATFFLPGRQHSERLVLRLADYVPRRSDDREQGEAVDRAIQAMAEAIRRAAHEPPATRLDRLRVELIEAHRRVFGDVAADPEALVEWPAALSASASVIGALASVAKLVIG